MSETKIDPEIKAQWVAALRDPEKYAQARDCLCEHVPEGTEKGPKILCCLGVLNDISDLGFWNGAEYQDMVRNPKWEAEYTEYLRQNPGALEYAADFASSHYPEFISEEEGLHPHVLEWLGLAMGPTDLKIPYMEKEVPIIVLNDDKGLSFADLADLIDEHL